MYTHNDWNEINTMLKKRWLMTLGPTLVVMAGAIALFVIGRINRSDSMWILTSFLTILGGGYFLFFFGVYVRPTLIYRKHLRYMLNGRMRETTGVLKSISEDVNVREGLECYAMFINVGQKNDPEDDRLFYYDVYKPLPEMPIGAQVTVLSNDKMVSSIKEI